MTRTDAGGVATVTLQSPGLSHRSRAELIAVLRAVRADGSVRAVVLTGAGRAFCVGQDLAEHVEALRADPATAMDVVAESYNPIALALAALRVPVVVAVNGTCVGARLGLALAGDVLATAATDSLEDSLALEARLQVQLGQTADHREAVEAFLAERTPAFTGR